MMSVNQIQSPVCHVTVLADAGLRLWSVSTRLSMSDRMPTAVGLTATGVIVNDYFLNVTYSAFKYST